MRFIVPILIFIASFFHINSAQTQTYNNGVGIRIGIANGVGVAIDYKHFFSEKIALEAFIDFNRGLTWIGGLLEFHKGLYQVGEGFSLYYGGGAALATGNGFSRVALLGVAGLEFKFADLPINLAFDWTPSFLLGQGGRFNADSLSLIIRYTF